MNLPRSNGRKWRASTSISGSSGTIFYFINLRRAQQHYYLAIARLAKLVIVLPDRSKICVSEQHINIVRHAPQSFDRMR
jgi:hypothetical protein